MQCLTPPCAAATSALACSSEQMLGGSAGHDSHWGRRREIQHCCKFNSAPENFFFTLAGTLTFFFLNRDLNLFWIWGSKVSLHKLKFVSLGWKHVSLVVNSKVHQTKHKCVCLCSSQRKKTQTERISHCAVNNVLMCCNVWLGNTHFGFLLFQQQIVCQLLTLWLLYLYLALKDSHLNILLCLLCLLVLYLHHHFLHNSQNLFIVTFRCLYE